MSLEQTFKAFDEFPTTRIRVLVTIVLIAATGVIYLMHACDLRMVDTLACSEAWEPSTNWLVFLSALAGVDVTQYFVKGFTAVQQSKVDATVTNTNTLAATSITNVNTTVSGQSDVSPSDDGVTSTSDISELNRESELKG